MNDAAFIGLLRVVVKRKGDLEGQLTLEKHRKDVEEEVARLKGVDTATSYRKATDTGKITIKSAELMRTCVTQAVEKRFEEECKNLKLKKIALRDIGGAKGRLRHRPSLTGTAASTRLTDVLSEFQESYGLPISTYLPEPPYGIGASLPTAFYNLNSPGLDQVAIRKAIAIAVDYPTIIANAMTNQSATFDQVPRSLMNPTPGEQALYDHEAVKDLQWAGNDIEGAIKLLDDAGVVDTDGDGWREYNGQKLSYVATCPNGWSDWQAAIEVVAAAGKKIGIDITTNYPEWGVYQTVVTKSDAPLPEGYDIFMMWSAGAGPTQPWGRIRNLLSSEWIGLPSNWSGNWGQYSNPRVDELIKAIPAETDEAKLKEIYTELVQIYLTEVPSFTLMYRPQSFHTVNESVWTGFPHEGDGTNPPVPPLDLTDGWSIAGLYNLTLVE